MLPCFIGVEHVYGDGATEGWVVGDDGARGVGFGELFGEGSGEARDRGGGFGEAFGVAGIFFAGLMFERE